MTATNTFEWVPEPPARGASGRPEGPEWERLRSRPGQWACIRRAMTGAGATGSMRKRHRDFEIVARNTCRVDGKLCFDIYARYSGEQQP